MRVELHFKNNPEPLIVGECYSVTATNGRIEFNRDKEGRLIRVAALDGFLNKEQENE